MNRAPGKSDTWWAKHEAECGGTYTKIQSPDLTKKQRDALSKKERAGLQKNKLDSWVKTEKKPKATLEGNTSGGSLDIDGEGKTSQNPRMKRKAELIVVDDVVSDGKSKKSRIETKDKDVEDDELVVVESKTLVECPICSMRIAEEEINEHLDVVHPP